MNPPNVSAEKINENAQNSGTKVEGDKIEKDNQNLTLTTKSEENLVEISETDASTRPISPLMALSLKIGEV